MAEELERQEADRKLQAEKLKNKLEVGNWAFPFLADFFRKAESGILFNFHPCCTQEDKKEQENGIVTMFERLKGENEVWRQKNPSRAFQIQIAGPEKRNSRPQRHPRQRKRKDSARTGDAALKI